jgi:hypothetical protein
MLAEHLHQRVIKTGCVLHSAPPPANVSQGRRLYEEGIWVNTPHFCQSTRDRSFKLLFCGLPESLISHSTPDTTNGAVASGDRSTEGKPWTRCNARFAKCNGWPKPPSLSNLPSTALALAEGTPRSPTRKPRVQVTLIFMVISF